MRIGKRHDDLREGGRSPPPERPRGVNYPRLASHFGTARAEAKWDEDRAAAVAGLTKSELTRAEKGKGMNVDTFARLCQAYGLNAQKILNQSRGPIGG